MHIVGIITARGGSKGIPGKNIKPFGGTPLIAHTIAAAKESGALDRLILSTDDEAIAAVAREHGCEAPFVRPAALATDEAGHVEVLQHAVLWLKEQGEEPDAVMLLQPTAPLRQAAHIKEAVELLRAHPEADSVLSVARVPSAYRSQKTMRIVGERLVLLGGEPIYRRVARRQDLQDEYFSAGMIYLFKPAVLWGDPPSLYGETTLPYVVEEKYLADIDTPEDWARAEAALRALNE